MSAAFRSVLLLALVIVPAAVYSQLPPRETVDPRQREDELTEARGKVARKFDLANIDDTIAAKRSRTTAINAANDILKRQAKELPIEDDIIVTRAAELLGELNANDRSSILALIAILSFSPAISLTGEPDPLESLDAAKALRRIGGKTVAAELARALQVPRTRKEHLIIANILAACDDPEVSAYRLRLAIERERAKDSPHLVHIRELEAVKHWLDTPGLLEERENWPSRM